MAVHDKAGMLVATLFLARDLAHREHLKSTSYAQHMALGDFYSGIVDLADSLAEAYQGCFDVVLDIPLLAHQGDELSITQVLTSHRDWISKTRYEAIPHENTALHNIIDDIEVLYYSTIYKLRRLN